jgi:transcriptional regulator with XRE-family HTH domain
MRASSQVRDQRAGPLRAHTLLHVSNTRRGQPQTEFGRYLRGLMDAKGLVQDADLGRLADVNPSLLSKWQSGSAVPTVESLRKLAPHLGVRLGDLMVKAGLATSAELGITGAPPPPSVPLPPVLRRIAIALSDTRVPEAARAALLRGVQAAYDVWTDMVQIRASNEAGAAERAGRRRPPSSSSR